MPISKADQLRRERTPAVPTGVAIRDVREQLFAAAERVLLRDGPSALTSRAVTSEAGFAKGVLHRHFADFDAFLTELVLARAEQIGRRAIDLRACAGTRTVAGNVTGALTELFGSVALEILSLLTSRNELRSRLREAGAGRLPVLREGTAMIRSYLEAERDLGRVAADAELHAIAPMLIGTAHLMFAGRDGVPLEKSTVHTIVTTALAPVLPGEELGSRL
jgi:AcrR family transcriptional regulator